MARRQHGVAARRQLLRLGATVGQIDGWVARKRLHVVYRGVYLVGPVVQPHAHEMAAVLACGPGAALSHASAIHLYEALPYPARPGPPQVTVPGGHGSRPLGIVVHRSHLAAHEVRRRHGIPVTSPVRTLIDFAGCATEAELERAVAEAFALRLTTRAALLRAVPPRRRGARRLRALLDAGPKRTRSRPERVLLAGLRAAGIEEPEVNARIGRWEVDFHWPAHRLAVEVDGYAAHSSPTAFERDRRKDAELSALGVRVQRHSAREVHAHLGAVIARIRRALGG